MEDFLEFDEKMLFDIGLTKQESELIYLIHPNFEGLPVYAAAELLGISRRTCYNILKKIIEKFPAFAETMSKAIKDRQNFRKNIRNPKRFGEMQDIGTEYRDEDGDMFFGERVVRVF